MQTLSRSLRPFYLAVIFLSGVSGPAARAQTVTPLPSPTIITTAPYTITKPGFYQLGADLYYAGNGTPNDAIITIAASNVTLDFAGHYISGPSNSAGTTLFGVFANERGNLNIQNGTVTFCFVGVYLFGNNSSTSININQRVQNMLLSHCYYIGLDLYFASNCDAINNRISFIGGSTAKTDPPSAIYGVGSANRVVDCNITTVALGTGINFKTLDTGFAIGNTISNCYTAAINVVLKDTISYNCKQYYLTSKDAGNNSMF